MLTDRRCRTAVAAGKAEKLYDGGGLLLLVKPSGYKSWRFKYRFGGKEKQLTFGPFPLVALAEARTMRDAAKRQLLAGVDPARKSAQIRAQRLGQEEALTFERFAKRWHGLQSHGWKPRHAEHVLASLMSDAFPAIGAVPLAELRPADIRAVIEAVQDRGAVDQAHRLLNRITRVFDLAVVEELVETNPAASLSPILRPVPKRKYPAIVKLPDARAALKAFEEERHQPTVKLASRLLALTAARPGPLRFAEPAEFLDLDGADPRWVIPAAKMKLERAEAEQEMYEFIVPLAPAAVAVVKAALEFAGRRRWLFPSTRSAVKPISENALNIAYRRSPAFCGRHVPHGWRSSFATIMNERAADLDRLGDRAIIDLMLAHKPEGVEAAYNRAAYLQRRRKLACEWAELLTPSLVPAEQLLEGPRH